MIPPSGRGRDPGIDLARGLAVVLMVQTHAYDGWASPEARRSVAYQLTRVLGAIPAPLFLLLAGVGMALGAEAALRRGRDAAAVRRQLVRRGLEVACWGYGVSFLYAILDGDLRAAALLRVDILHCIGLSMVVCAVLLVARPHATRRIVLLASAVVAAGPLLLPILPSAAAVPAGLRPLLALVIDVPPYTRFPLVPLLGYVALGYGVGLRLASGRGRSLTGMGTGMGTGTGTGAGPGPGPLLALILGAAACHHATGLLVRAWGGPLSRTHPAVVLNFLDGAARAGAVLVLGLWAGRALPDVRALSRLGRGSLLAYAVHIPFCYGRPARPISHRLDMAQATLAFCALLFLTWGIVWTRDRIRAGWPRRGPRA